MSNGRLPLADDDAVPALCELPGAEGMWLRLLLGPRGGMELAPDALGIGGVLGRGGKEALPLGPVGMDEAEARLEWLGLGLPEDTWGGR